MKFKWSLQHSMLWYVQSSDLKLSRKFRVVTIVTEKENVMFKVNEIMQIITEVFNVPNLKDNLLSIGQLPKKNVLQFLYKKEDEAWHRANCRDLNDMKYYVCSICLISTKWTILIQCYYRRSHKNMTLSIWASKLCWTKVTSRVWLKKKLVYTWRADNLSRWWIHIQRSH